MRRLSVTQRRVAVLAVWAGVVIAWLWHARSTGDGVTDSLQRLVDALSGRWWAIPAYVVAYMARPLLLFPASLLTIAGGILFGPAVGIAVVLVASNASAMVAYGVGRALSSDPSRKRDATSLVTRWSERLRARSFVTVLVMRLAFLPYDLVNYACGALVINPGAFLAATAIGSLPGTISFVLAGASLHRVDRGLHGFDPKVFAASVLLFVVSLAIAKAFQRREAATAIAQTGEVAR